MANLKKGSTGSGVKDWQKYLNTQGFNLKEDGIFGNDTKNATMGYQKAKGLSADGIVGPQTLGSMTGGGKELYSATAAPNVGSAPALPTFKEAPELKGYDTTSYYDTERGQAAEANKNAATEAVKNYGDFTYEDYVMGDDAQAAKGALDAHNANKPGEYQSQWQSQLDGLMNQIMNREKFSYDLNGDALYQQYKDQYIQQGKMAMMDTMGQATAMNGGYGSSYAQSVGQQAYQGQLDNLNDVVPELYAMARDQYNREGQDLYNQYGMVVDRENTDYGRYMDALNTWMTDRGYLTDRADTEADRDYGQYMDKVNLDHTLHAEGYGRLLDALGIASDDFYKGADIFQSEQNTKNSITGRENDETLNIWNTENSLTQQGYENAFGEWRANTADNQWKADFDREGQWRDEDIERADSKATGSGSGENGSSEKDTTPTNPQNPTPQPVTPKETKNTTTFINSYMDKSRFLASGKSEKEWLEYVEDKITSFVRSGRLTDEEALYLINYYGIS